MALRELTPDQVRDLSLEEKDRWWRDNVYRGDMPQLNLRSALTGMALGGVLSLTNLYVGIRTGWTLGVGISSVILSFAIFKLFSRLRVGTEMTVLENNAMQSIATSAGYATAPLVSSIPAYMLVSNQVVPPWQVFWWTTTLAVLGVLFAFPLKKRFINDEQLRFPEGYAAGVVLDGLHEEHGGEGAFKVKLLALGAAVAALIQVWRSEAVMAAMKLRRLAAPEYWTDLVYRWVDPRILGTPMSHLTLQLDSSIVMMGTGGLMGTKAAMSILLGAVVNFCVVAPIMIRYGVIPPEGGYRNIVGWSLWGGAACMTTSSLYGFFARPKLIVDAFKRPFAGKGAAAAPRDVLADVELPMWVFVVGIPIVGAVVVVLGHLWFDVTWWLGVVAIPLVFVFTLVAVNSTGLTSITPGGALGKLTQVTYSVLAPGNARTNLITAGITSEVALSASNLLMDIKPGYMLGAKPRQQAIGHVLGIYAGALVAIPVYYAIFGGDLSLLTSDRLPLPGATVWRAVAELLTRGLSTLHPSARWAVLVGALLGIAIEMANQRRRGRFPISGVGLGLAFTFQFADSLSMAIGALVFWAARRVLKDERTALRRAFVENQETISGGVIAGGSIIGIILILLETAVLKSSGAAGPGAVARARLSRGVKRRSDGAAPRPHHRPGDEQQGDGADEAADEPRAVELAVGAAAQGGGHQSSRQRAHHPQHGGEDEAHLLPAGHDGAGQQADDEAEDDPGDDPHVRLPVPVKPRARARTAGKVGTVPPADTSGRMGRVLRVPPSGDARRRSRPLRSRPLHRGRWRRRPHGSQLRAHPPARSSPPASPSPEASAPGSALVSSAITTVA